MSDVTVVLTHWKRPEGLRAALAALDAQNPRPQIWLWNNAGLPLDDPRIAWEVVSGQNRRCWPRWWMAADADTPFVAIHDDDFAMSDRHVLRDALSALRERPAGTIVGRRGLSFQAGESLRKAKRVFDVTSDEPVDVPCQFTLLRTDDLAAVSLRPHQERKLRELAEYIAVAGLLSGGQPRRHVVPQILAHRFQELPQTDALFRTAGFWDIAEQARRRFFSCK